MSRFLYYSYYNSLQYFIIFCLPSLPPFLFPYLFFHDAFNILIFITWIAGLEVKKEIGNILNGDSLTEF